MSLWERDTRVPLIFAGPGIKDGLLSNRPVGLIDIYPTLLELAGLPVNEQNEGRSLTPLMEDINLHWPHPAISSFGPNNISLRDQWVRYIRYEDGSEEFYDHRSDPHEWYNLASEPESRREISTIIKQMEKHIPKNPAPLSKYSSFRMNEYFIERMDSWRKK